MQDNPVPSKLQNWIKPIAIITLVFIFGFSIPVFIKNYLSQKAGIIPTPSPPGVSGFPIGKELTAPYYSFETEEITLSPGETAKIKAFINTNKRTIQAYDFIATYNPAVVTVTAVEATPLFPSYPAIEYGEGTIVVGGNIGVEEESFAVRDTLLLITLEGKSLGETALTVDMDKSTIATKGENILKDSNSVKITVQ